MSLENTLERIATALEKMAACSTPTPTAAPAAPAAPAAFPASQLPFHDAQALSDWLVAKYQSLEKAKPGSGARIQDCINALGVTAVNEVPITAYPQLFASVNSL